METTEKAANSVGLVSCACLNEHATLKFEKCGFFFVTHILFVALGTFGCYFSTIARNLMSPFLPLISNAAGEPPSTGVFTFFVVISLFFALFAYSLLYVTVDHRNVWRNKSLKRVNLICLSFVGVAWIGLITTACHPVGFTDLPNKFQWVVTVLYQHSCAATLILTGLGMFQLLFAVLWWYLPDTTKSEKYTKISFVLIYILLALIIIYPLPVFIMEVMDNRPFDFEYMKTVSYTLPREYSTVNLIASICEWIICVLSMINIILHCKDLQRVSCRIVFRHKSCLEDEPVQLKVISS